MAYKHPTNNFEISDDAAIIKIAEAYYFAKYNEDLPDQLCVGDVMTKRQQAIREAAIFWEMYQKCSTFSRIPIFPG